MAARVAPRRSGTGTSLRLVRALLDGESPNGPDDRLLALTTGRFYTHEFIGRRLARQVARTIWGKGASQLSIVDPFCGDGRLVAWLIEELARDDSAPPHDLSIELWDCDPTAVRQATRRIRGLANDGGTFRVSGRVWDTFERAPERFGEFDIVITNPPWELLKPDPRQLRALTEEEAREYARTLRAEDARLSRLYPAARPSVRYAGWGFNLSRSGTEAALRLLNLHGTLGLVAPASILADNSSRRLRQLIVEEFQLRSIDYYPSETRLFPTTDHPAVSLVIRHATGSGLSAGLTVFDESLQVRTSGRLRIPHAELRTAEFVIPGQFSPQANPVLRKIRRFGEFASLEHQGESSLVAGRELDETRISERLSSTGSIRFVKGRMVHRYSFELAQPKFLKPGVEVPESASHTRIAWRDVSRMSQARRIQACILPRGVVTGNSLSVAYFRDDHFGRLQALLAIMNSIVFEFQVRTHLATSHISLASVRKGRLPPLERDGFIENMARLCSRRLGGDTPADVEIEVRSAQAYGLSRKEFGVILPEFVRLGVEAKDELLSSSHWRAVPDWAVS